MTKDHIAKHCARQVFCYRCKAQSRHNTAICSKGFGNSSSFITGSNQSVLLQTANGYIADEKEGKIVTDKDFT